MVYLSELDQQFPWASNAPQDYSDKEILTQRIACEDASNVWKAEIHQCLPGFAYVGFRIRPVNKEIPMMVRLRCDQYHDSPLLSNRTDAQVYGPATENWTRFTYPIPSRLCALNEDEPCLEVHFETPAWGVVEFLAQRFYDFPDEDNTMTYYKYSIDNSPHDQWLHTPHQEIYRCSSVEAQDILRRDYKIIPIRIVNLYPSN
jgi:hypothetical protein